MNTSYEEAEAFTRVLVEQIVEAIGPLRDRRARAAAAHVVYAHVAEVSRGYQRFMPDDAAVQDAGKHMVYLLYGKSGQLLYVGITDRGPVRLAEHYRRKPWFHSVERVEFERYPSRDDSEARERYLIQNRAPLHNIQHNQGRHIA